MVTEAPAASNFPESERLITVPASMRAAFYDDYGPPEVLRYGSLRTPTPRDGQVQIRVMAASVNPIDWRIRSGEMRYLLPGGFPRVPGYDVAGYLHDPEETSGIGHGSRVMAFLDSMYGGGYAEWAVCSPRSVASIPDILPFEEAAALPLAGSTALQSLRDHGQIASGDRVLINGASGAVGGYAVQIAKAYGARVTGVASGQSEDYVRSLGADEFINYHERDFTDSAERWDLVFDAAGKSSFRQARRVLRPHGHYVSTEPNLEGMVTSIATLVSAQRGRVMLARSRRRDLVELIRLFEAEKLRIRVDDSLPLSEAAEAQRRSEHGEVRGKLILRCDTTA